MVFDKLDGRLRLDGFDVRAQGEHGNPRGTRREPGRGDLAAARGRLYDPPHLWRRRPRPPFRPFASPGGVRGDPGTRREAEGRPRPTGACPRASGDTTPGVAPAPDTRAGG